MSRDVFISYSTNDQSIAQAACGTLEDAGIGCWIAPRDILPGRTWSGAIVEGIDGSRAVVVLLSAKANVSRDVLREVE